MENTDPDERDPFLQGRVEPWKTQIKNYDTFDLKNCLPSDIVSGFNEVRKDLKDYIDPENGLLHRLSNQAIIDYADIKILEKIKPYQLLNEKLLGRISININSISKQFIEALCEDEQDHIAKFIVTGGRETNSDERLLPRELRKVIEVNMFCLDKLIDTEKHELLFKLVRAKCITVRHRHRVICSKPDERAYELLTILKRRRYKDFFNFMDCLRKSLQGNMVRILEKRGVFGIKLQLLQERPDKRDIEAELIRKLTGCVDKGDRSNLSEDQKQIVDDILAELREENIYFTGTCAVTSNSDSS
jgi:hypothetical protein